MSGQTAVEDVHLDERCQARSELSADAVAEYAAEYTAHRELPAIDVFDVAGSLYVVDGFHRYAAALTAGLDFIRVRVVGSGDFDAASWHATSVNQGHGVRRTNADKRRAVQMAIESAIGSGQSSRAVAEHCGVSPDFVGKMRKASGLKPTKIKGKDGRVYPAKQVSSDDTCTPNPAESLTPDFGVGPSWDDGVDDFAPLVESEGVPMPGYGPALEALEADIMKVRRACAALLRDDATSAVGGRARECLSNAAGALKYAVPVECGKCNGDGCRSCSGNGWLPRGHVTQ